MEVSMEVLVQSEILFVDEALSPIASLGGDVPHVGDEVQWGQEVYEVLTVRRYYEGTQEPAFAARVVVRPLTLDE